MSTNTYFEDLYNSHEDQNLFEELIVECIKQYGRDFYYIPRTLTNFDSFFGEDSQSAFKSAFKVELYLENIQQWGDQGNFLSKFNVEIRDSAKLVVAQTRFKEVVTSQLPNIVRPREGDILAFPEEVDGRTRFFEITYVDKEDVFYQLGKLYTWAMTMKNFEYNGEEFATGVDNLDEFNPDAFIPKPYVVDPSEDPILVPNDNQVIEDVATDLIDQSESNPLLT